jgi:hypothetical protein
MIQSLEDTYLSSPLMIKTNPFPVFMVNLGRGFHRSQIAVRDA